MNVRRATGAARRPERAGWGTAIAFVLLAGLAAESFEIARIQSGGIAPPSWSLRLTLWAAYAAAAGFFYAVGALVARAHALALAATAVAVLVVVPWLNFAYLPRAGSAQSLLGSAAAIALLAAAVPLALRLRRIVVAALLVAVVAANGWGALRGGTAGRPLEGRAAAPPFNVLVVLLDTLRADHLGAYGYRRPTSPRLDALAAESVVFEQAVAQAPWTKPSVASLMTGVFVHKHGVVSSGDALGPELPTLAEALQGRGYRTAAFSANPWITPEFRFDRGFAEFESGRAMGAQLTNFYRLLKRTDRALKGVVGVRTNLAGLVFRGSSGNPGNSERDRLLTDSVVEWLGRHGREPFFLYVHLIGPHDPYDPPAEYVARFREPGWDGRRGPTVPPERVQTVFDQAQPLADGERAALIAQYDAAIAHTDDQLGRIVDAVAQAGQLERTLIVVTSDHGEEFYEHGNWRHGNQLYNEVVHVPLTFRLPSRLPAGRRQDLAMLVDVLPTVVGLVDGEAAEPGGDGRALFAAAAGAAPTAFAEHWWFEGGTYTAKMVRRGTLKLHDARDEGRNRERSELYDLAADGGEARNLLENPAVVSENVLGELQTLLARFGDKVSVASVSVDMDQSTRERLRQLGY